MTKKKHNCFGTKKRGVKERERGDGTMKDWRKSGQSKHYPKKNALALRKSHDRKGLVARE